MLSGNPFDFGRLNTNNPWSVPINRRQFLATGLATPFVSANRLQRDGVEGLFPVPMNRCVIVTGDSDRLSMVRRFAQHYEHSDDWVGMFPNDTSSWSCKLVRGVRGHRVKDWWLLVSLPENQRPQLTVLHVSSEALNDVGMTGLLIARITFRLHALQQCRVFQGNFNKYHVVRKVNQQILRAMDKLPV